VDHPGDRGQIIRASDRSRIRVHRHDERTEQARCRSRLDKPQMLALVSPVGWNER
jgi:hypothetical protein